MIAPDSTNSLLALERLTADCTKMKGMLAGLLDSKGKVAEEIHAIRKLGKSLRGGFALFQLEQSAAREIQAIGRLLARPRDAVSRLNTWNKLSWKDDPALAAAITGLLDQETHSAARRPPPNTISWCIERVSAALDDLQKLPPEQLPNRIAKGLAKLEKRTLKRCRKLDHDADEAFHDVRKAVKAWLGGVGFFPDDSLNAKPLLDQMAERLGDENDLATLSAWLEGHGFTRRFAPGLWDAITAVRRRLQAKAIKDAKRLASG